MSTLRHWAPVALIVISRAVTPAAVAQNAPPARSPACTNEQNLTYICDLGAPEDIVTLGSTGLLLASGHLMPGHLYLIDPAAQTVSELLQGAAFTAQQDSHAYPDCPGPPNRQAVDVHGLSLAETSPRHFAVYTTSHGAREAIEIYDLDLSSAAPVLAWKGCVLLQQDGYHNSVARLPDGGFVTTRMRDHSWQSGGAPIGITGQLFEWHPGGPLQPLAGSELSLPNGIAASPDGRYVFVAAFGSQEVVRFDRRSTPAVKRTVPVPIRPDNIHWDANGKLLIAGRNYVTALTCRGEGCATGWSVIEFDPETMEFSRLGGADETAALQAASAAARLGDEIWVASNDDRVARFSLQQP
jgi:hypothetical protein